MAISLRLNLAVRLSARIAREIEADKDESKMKRLSVEELKLARIGIGLFFLVIASLTLGAQSKKGTARPVWPKTMGEYAATSSERIPLFPRTLSGYRSE